MIRRAHDRLRFRLVSQPSPIALRTWLRPSLNDRPWKRDTPWVSPAHGGLPANRRAGARGVRPNEVKAFLPGRREGERSVRAPAPSAGRQTADWTSALFIGPAWAWIPFHRDTRLDCFVLDRGRIGRPWMTPIADPGGRRVIADRASLLPLETVGPPRFQRSPPVWKAGRPAALGAALEWWSPGCCRALVSDHGPEFRADASRRIWQLVALHLLSSSAREVGWNSWLERATAILVRPLFEERRP